MEASGQPHAPAALPRENDPRFLFTRRLCRDQGWPACFGEKTNLFPLPRIEIWYIVCPAQGYVTELTRDVQANGAWLLGTESTLVELCNKRWEPVRAPSQGGPTKNLCTKSERLTLIFGVTWAQSERVNLYSRQIMLLPLKTKTYATYLGPGPPSGPPGFGNLYGFRPDPLFRWHWVLAVLIEWVTGWTPKMV